MTFTSRLRTLRGIRERNLIRGRGKRRKAGPRRLYLERLEERMLLSTFFVTNTGDNGGVNPAPLAATGTLRQAILDANAAGTGTPANPDLIQFNIPTTDPGYQSGTGAFSIKPLSALPTITDTLVLDGYTEPGASPNTLAIGDNAVLNIVLDGSKAGAVDGLVIAGGNSTVRGLVIDKFAEGAGLLSEGSGHDLVVGNFIGTDVTGLSAAANNIGILTNSNNDIIGSPSPGDRNIISGNNSSLPDAADGGSQPAGLGIDLSDGSLIQGNNIGTDKTGTFALANGNGVVSTGSHNTIGGTSTGAGNVISGNYTFGILEGGHLDLVAGNLIGTTATGLAALSNGAGIHLTGNYNTIGGTTAEARNIIAGITGPGGGGFLNAAIDIENAGPISLAGGSYNLVEGNYIGTDITGTTSLGGQTGIVIAGAYNTIGGTTAAARNVISGNNGFGIMINNNGPLDINFGNVVQGNYIGTDPTGARLVGNRGHGIYLLGATHDNIIGGPLPGEGNLVSGNIIGIYLNSTPNADPTNNLIQSNLVGTDKTGSVAFGNSEGIVLQFANNNTIGGTASGAGNIIAYNAGTGSGDGYGVNVYAGTGNSILSNSIFSNGRLGINLNSANNANDNQAFPVLTGAGGSATGTSISGTFASVASTTFRIEFFDNQSPDPSGYGQGQTYLGFATVTTDGSGHVSFNATGLAALPAGQRYLSATATNVSTGDTSQFSQDLFIPFTFSGFLPPLSNNMAFGLNRTIPIKFQLHDFDGSLITALSAVTSLQIQALDATGHAVGSPFNPTPTGGTTLRNDGSQYVFNWQTKGLSAGSYEILLTLADGTVHTKIIQLSANGSAAGLTTVSAGGTASANAGALLAGDVELFVNDPNGMFSAAELARIQDAIASVDVVVSPYGVTITEVTDSSSANVTLDTGSTSAVGGYASGVLGCTTDAGQITIIAGWNFYAGSDATQIGAGQYDFQTVVTHELGHALGLGHSANAASVMYATLTTGTTNRALAAADLNVPDSDTGGACGLHAAPSSNDQEPNSKNQTTDFTDYTDIGTVSFLSVASVSSVVKTFGQDTMVSQDWNPHPHAALGAVLADWNSTTDFAGQVARILEAKEAMGAASHSQAKPTEPPWNDDFCSAIGLTPSWDQIIN